MFELRKEMTIKIPPHRKPAGQNFFTKNLISYFTFSTMALNA